MRSIKTYLFIAVCLFSLAPFAAHGEEFYSRVSFVVDGDTIILENGERVRYIGIDTPERDEPFYTEARGLNHGFVSGKKIRLVICPEEKRDKYKRLLAWVYVDATLVNAELLKKGLAKVLIIPPCGSHKAKEFRALEQKARQEKKGIWGPK
ncbi:MAG: thermonuclease family protein [Deltaproteobacteria bacterium]|nr:thermonuclease family protein [Deltaproteobacteria bacterium]